MQRTERLLSDVLKRCVKIIDMKNQSNNERMKKKLHKSEVNRNCANRKSVYRLRFRIYNRTYKIAYVKKFVEWKKLCLQYRLSISK